MDTQTLLRLAHSDNKIKGTLDGVFASDILPEKRGHYRSFIVNTDSSMSTEIQSVKQRQVTTLKVLFENILEPVVASKQISWSDAPDSPNFEAEFAYVHVLSDDDIIFHLHCI
ncbi:hypothetical protein TNCV_4085081 [Trichonephila clavipes]|nr:hypothetical protein TNCV_4085081 [Trichonephila clavipes]